VRTGGQASPSSGLSGWWGNCKRRAGRWPGSDFQEAVEVEDVAVSGDMARVVVRRSHALTGLLWFRQRREARAVETWWKLDGRWQLVEEQEL
jgi:hypothetical protein